MIWLNIKTQLTGGRFNGRFLKTGAGRINKQHYVTLWQKTNGRKNTNEQANVGILDSYCIHGSMANPVETAEPQTPRGEECAWRQQGARALTRVYCKLQEYQYDQCGSMDLLSIQKLIMNSEAVCRQQQAWMTRNWCYGQNTKIFRESMWKTWQMAIEAASTIQS